MSPSPGPAPARPRPSSAGRPVEGSGARAEPCAASAHEVSEGHRTEGRTSPAGPGRWVTGRGWWGRETPRGHEQSRPTRFPLPLLVLRCAPTRPAPAPRGRAAGRSPLAERGPAGRAGDTYPRGRGAEAQAHPREKPARAGSCGGAAAGARISGTGTRGGRARTAPPRHASPPRPGADRAREAAGRARIPAPRSGPPSGSACASRGSRRGPSGPRGLSQGLSGPGRLVPPRSRAPRHAPHPPAPAEAERAPARGAETRRAGGPTP